MTQIGAVENTPLPNFQQHLRFTIGAMQYMYFNGADNSEILSADVAKSIAFEFQKSDFTKNELRGIIKGIIPKPHDARGYALTLAGVLRGRFTQPEDEKFTKIMQGLSVDREEFIKYYKAIKQIKTANGLYDCFTKTEDLELYQFIFCATVFSELKILNINSGRVTINDRVSTDLFRSAAYNYVREKCLTKSGVGVTVVKS